jgi:hypothetical protein
VIVLLVFASTGLFAFAFVLLGVEPRTEQSEDPGA